MIDYMISATMILSALYMTVTFISFVAKQMGSDGTVTDNDATTETAEPVQDAIVFDPTPILEGMTLTHLRKLAIQHNRRNPSERIARAARLRRDEVIPALAAVWTGLPVTVEYQQIGG